MINKFTFYNANPFSLQLPPLFISNSVTGTINWGDGNITDYVYGYNSHSYSSGGTYIVTFTTIGGTEIGNGFCANNSYLISCELSEELTKIGGGTFYSASNLTILNVPPNCILEASSCSNSGLETVNFGSISKKSTIPYTSHSQDCFTNCNNLININYYSSLYQHQTISNYFIKNSNSYFLIKINDYEIRNIRIGSHMPSFKHINVERESKTVWKIALGSKIVWDLHSNEFKEHLKVYESCIGQKFLEGYNSQSIYTTVYWVHEVDGQEVETYLSSSELNSWECDTLEPYYYTTTNSDGTSRQYVEHYQLPIGKSFGEHDFKITYKSPDSNKILEAEYPIYYLEEKSFNMPKKYDWYPFRLPFAYRSIGASYLYFECTDKNGEKIIENIYVDTSFQEIRYTFPIIEKGQYKIGENQIFGTEYISSRTLRTYRNDLIVNIRHYRDERNPEKSYNYDSTSVNSYFYKDIRPLTIKYKFDNSIYYVDSNYDYYQFNTNNTYSNEYPTIIDYSMNDSFYGTLWIKENNIIKNGEIKNTPYVLAKLNSVQDKHYDFTFLKNDKEVYNMVLKSNNPKWKVDKLNNLLTGTTSGLTAKSFEEKMASCGYIYWGDGTLDFVSLSDSFYSPSNIYTNKTGTIKRTEFDNILVGNGTIIDPNSPHTRIVNYDNKLFGNVTHEYIGSDVGQFTVELTHYFGYELNSQEIPFTSHRNVGTSISSGTVRGNYYKDITDTTMEETILQSLKNGGSENMFMLPSGRDGSYNILELNDYTGSKNIIEVDFGQTAQFGVAYHKTTSINSNQEDFINFLPHYMLGGLGHLKKITIPKINSTDVQGSALAMVKGCNYVDTWNYEGLASDFINNNNLKDWICELSYQMYDPITDLSVPKAITIQCSDGNVIIED